MYGNSRSQAPGDGAADTQTEMGSEEAYDSDESGDPSESDRSKGLRIVEDGGRGVDTEVERRHCEEE